MSRQYFFLYSILFLLGLFFFINAVNRNILSLRILHGPQNYDNYSWNLDDHRLTSYKYLFAEIRKGNIDKSDANFITAQRYRYPLITSLYGELLQSEGDYYRGLEIWRQLGDLISIINAGKTAEQQKQYHKALSAYQIAHQLDPDNGEIQYYLARIFMKLGRHSQADKWFQSAIKLNPKREWNLERARNARINGNYRLAIAIDLEIIEKSPEFHETYYDIALVYLYLKMYPESKSAIERAINLANSPKAKYFIRAGNIYMSIGDISKAIVAYESALELDPNNIEIKKRLDRLIDN